MKTIGAGLGLILMLGCSGKPEHQPAKNPTDNGMKIPQGMPGGK